MATVFYPWQILVTTMAGWITRQQDAVIDGSLRKATREYAAHYHRERNHQGLDNRLIEPDTNAESASNAIKCAQRLGGMLRFYHRAAA